MIPFLRLVFSLLAIWSPRCLGCATGTWHRHGSRVDDDRPNRARTFTGATATATLTPFWHHRRRIPVVACMNHYAVGGGGAAALARPFWPGRGRGSVQHRGGPPALWSILTAGGMVAVASTRTAVSRLLASDSNRDKDGEEGAADNKLAAAMISFIKVYKKELSPLIPPACRFLPTCSEYGVKAIEEFGPTKGAVLTAWRLMRCNPFAGYGLDQPQWPPPGWFAGEKW